MKIAYTLLFSIFISSACWADEPKQHTIAVTQITAHPAIDAVREGLKSKLEELGFIPDENVKWLYENAYGNIATANQIAQKFAGLDPDIIIAITTPSAQSIASATREKETPIVFAAVTDPIGASLIESLDHPGGRITGTMDLPPLDDQLSLIHQMMGKRPIVLGIVYNSGEANSVYQVHRIRELATKYNITIVDKVADNSTKVLAAVHKLIPEVDAIYAPLDNVIAATLPSIVNTCLENTYEKKVPVFASDPEGVRQGALATIGFTHYKEGRLAGIYVSRILAGEHPANIPVTNPEASELYINTTTAKALNFKIPKIVLDKAEDIVRFE